MIHQYASKRSENTCDVTKLNKCTCARSKIHVWMRTFKCSKCTLLISVNARAYLKKSKLFAEWYCLLNKNARTWMRTDSCSQQRKTCPSPIEDSLPKSRRDISQWNRVLRMSKNESMGWLHTTIVLSFLKDICALFSRTKVHPCSHDSLSEGHMCISARTTVYQKDMCATQLVRLAIWMLVRRLSVHFTEEEKRGSPSTLLDPLFKGEASSLGELALSSRKLSLLDCVEIWKVSEIQSFHVALVWNHYFGAATEVYLQIPHSLQETFPCRTTSSYESIRRLKMCYFAFLRIHCSRVAIRAHW